MEGISEAAAMSTVLCVDSDRQWLSIVTREIKAAGMHEVIGTSDAAEGLQWVRDDDPDILITNYNMKLVRFLRHAHASPNREIPIIVATSRLSEAEIASMRDAGVNEIVARVRTH